ncbi:MAG: hypothetical protein GXY03_07460 [Solirubrobacterales bacterium]|nr:hypothetical protein [Solirubrobacterales bacterium]
MSRLSRPPLAPRTARGRRPKLSIGDYLCSDHDLYRVEHVGHERALLEDCRTGGLIDASFADLGSLRLVRRASGA